MKIQPPTKRAKMSGKLGLVARDKSNHPTSFRLSLDDKASLEKIVRDINKVSRSQVKTTDVLRALIRIGEGMEVCDILNAMVAII